MSNVDGLRTQLQNYLDIPDPPHGYFLVGIFSAAKWFNSLQRQEQESLVDYLIREYSPGASLSNGTLEAWVMLAGETKNSVFLPLIEKISERVAYLGHLCVDAKRKVAG